MKIKLLFLLVLYSFFHVTGFSQSEINTKKNSLEFLTGYNSGSLKNLAFAPVSRYDYNGPVYQLKYFRTSNKQNLFEVEIDYLTTELTTEIIPPLNADYSKVGLNFSYLKQVYIKNQLAIHAGLQSQTNVSSYIQWQAFDFQQKLGIASRIIFQVNEKHALSSKLTIPFILWRTSTFEENFYSLNNYQSVMWNAEYKYTLTNHVDMKASYSFNYDRIQISNTYRELQHQVNLGIIFNF